MLRWDFYGVFVSSSLIYGKTDYLLLNEEKKEDDKATLFDIPVDYYY